VTSVENGTDQRQETTPALEVDPNLLESNKPTFKNKKDQMLADLPALKNQTQRLAKRCGIEKHIFEHQIMEL
jgi:hypothetical protein